MRRVRAGLGALVLLVAIGCAGGSDASREASGASPPGSTATTATSTTTIAVMTTAEAPPAFASEVTAVTAVDLPSSWREGCPLGPESLRRLRLTYWGFDDRAHDGVLIVNERVVDGVAAVFRALYEQRFPIRRMEPVDAYGGSDDASAAADNTSSFNCRYAVADGPPSWSQHAYGLAIDVDPVENPAVLDGAVLPPGGEPYLDRRDVRPGMAIDGGVLVEAFTSIGWGWGGRWADVDYQHFSATGT